MSMNMRLRTISDEEISDIEEEPLRLEIYHYGELLDPSVLEDYDEVEKEDILNWKPKSNPKTFYLEAAFQSLHYLLTLQTEWNTGEFPLNFITGQRLNIGEIGWGKGNFYTSSEVRDISHALTNLNLDTIRERYNAEFFNEKKIYPRGYKWTDTDADLLIKTLIDLRLFIDETAGLNLGMYIVTV